MLSRILFVITKLELGGAQQQLLALIRNLNQEKFQPFLFTSRDGLLIEDAQAIKGLILWRSQFLERRLNPLKDLLSFFQLRSLIKRNNIQIVHTHSSKAGILGRLAAASCRTKIILHTVHGWSFHDFQPVWLRWLFIWLERYSAKFCSRLIVVSDADQRKGLACGIGSPEKYQRINYGIDYRAFQNHERGRIRELGIGADELVVGMVACFKPQKAPLDFIKTAALLKKDYPQVKFILVGDGMLRKAITKAIYRYQLEGEIFLLGWRSDIPVLLSSFDIFLLTSLWEGLPIAVLEAMASCLPIVATDTGGISEVVSDGKNGFLAAPGDVSALAQKSLLLLKDSVLRKRLGEKAKAALAESFLVENMLKSHYNLYRELLSYTYAV
jgi:glycosyltransferase involved in cell wall biosynthesis